MGFARLAAAAFMLVAAALPAGAADTYDVNVVMPLTGGGSFLANAERQSLQLAETLANRTGGIHGKPLRFVFHDDQSSPQISVQLASAILAERPAVMLGSSLVAMCRAIGPLMQNGPVAYCFSPGIHPTKGSYQFTSSVSTLDLANALIRYFRLKGWTKLALMTSTDASGQDAEHGINDVLALPENREMKLVERAHFNTTDVSVAAQIENVKAANPQAFIAWSTGTPIATILRAVKQAELAVPVATTDGNMTRAQMAQYAAFLPEALYFPASQWVVGEDARVPLDPAVAARQKAFYAAFKEAGVEPDVASELAWDPANIVIEALRTLPEGVTAAQVRDHLQALKGFAGVNGIYDFARVPQRGLDVENAVVTRWDAGAKRWVVVSKPTGVPLEP
jgi:branched-chain amino acid transport system substrate-binding protein